MSEPRWLTEPEERAWRAYRQMQTLLPSRLAKDLSDDSALSEADFEVLSTLSEKPSNQWQLRDLAAKMLWSRSRLSHHVARMEARGLVSRHDDPDDARGCIIALSDTGLATLRGAAPHHVESVRRHFIDRLSPAEIDVLTTIAERVTTGLAEPQVEAEHPRGRDRSSRGTDRAR